MAGDARIVLAAVPPDPIGGYLSGLERGQAYRARETAAANEKQDREADLGVRALTVMLNGVSDIKTAPAMERQAKLDRLKSIAARVVPNGAALIGDMTLDDLPALESGLMSVADRQGIALNDLNIRKGEFGLRNDMAAAPFDLEAKRLGIEADRMGLDTARRQNAYWDRQMGGEAVATPAAYQPIISGAASANGIDPTLLAAQVKAESNFNPAAVSPAGAGGLLQIMPDTARQPGYGIAPITDAQRFDPQAGVQFGAEYLAKLRDAFGGNIEHALVAYNWGPGNAKRWVEAGADPAQLPAETRNYVGRIMADFRASGGGGQPAAPVPYQRGNGSMLMAAPEGFTGQPVAAGAPSGPAAQPAGPMAAPAPAQSVVELAQRDPLTQQYARAAMEAQRFGDTAGAARANAMVEARMKELQAQLAAKAPASSKKLTEQQSKDLYFLNRAKSSMAVLDKAASALTDYGDYVASGIPLVGNSMKSDEYRMAEQAGREFIASVLRKETGAAVTEAEMNFYRPMLLPVPGDDAQVIERKKQARIDAIRGFELGLGGLAGDVGAGAPPSSPGGMPIPQELQGEPDGTIVRDDSGATFVIRGGMLVPS